MIRGLAKLEHHSALMKRFKRPTNRPSGALSFFRLVDRLVGRAQRMLGKGENGNATKRREEYHGGWGWMGGEGWYASVAELALLDAHAAR